MIKSRGKGLFIGYVVVAALLSLMMFFSGALMLMRHPTTVEGMHEGLGVPLGLFPVLGLLKIAGVLGLLAGIWRPRVGIAAGIGLVLYFVGALVTHAAARDFSGMSAPIVPLVLACAALILRVKSLRSGGSTSVRG